MKLLITGGAGFIGSNFIHYILKNHPEDEVVNFDKLTYAGNLANLKDVETDKRYKFFKGDIADKSSVLEAIGDCEAIINFAADTHVDRSLLDPDAFIRTDIIGTRVLLDVVKEKKLKRYIQISTDEVYGDVEKGIFCKETDPLRPSSPYSASKAAADLLVLAYRRTWNLPVLITRCTNNYGPNQYPEKFIPLAVTNLLQNQKVPVYGDGLQVRDWLYVEDHCRGVDLVLRKGQEGEVYNFGANQDPEWPNLKILEAILKQLNKGDEFKSFVADRAGHDRRYAVDTSKAEQELGWRPTTGLTEGLKATVEWYVDRQDWWHPLKSGEFLAYYKKQYQDRK
ncbi:dTDP-glucose 4,6-dehydratase [Candidatus Parcubacteria bacterium]|jgi:dTDP-glucose 4,6-dehydratase|nr:MAG: dTDP-glucose 4,6-dehydratase [Candidatus Parcubacteria bacterium]